MELEPKEYSDLLRKRNTSITNGHLSHEELRGPPDGGFRAYTVVIASFLTNGLLFGVINSYGVINTALTTDLKNETNSASSAAFVGSLAMGTTFLLSPLSGVLTGLLGLRMVAVIGGVMASTGMLMSSFVAHNINILLFTYGIMYGLGASLAYTPSLAILGHYFKKHLGLVNGIVTIGSSIFTVIMPVLMNYMIESYSLPALFRLLASFTFGIALCGLLFKPIPLMHIEEPKKKKGFKFLLLSAMNTQIWKNKMYLFWALSMPVALFGYFVPYVHMHSLILHKFSNVNKTLPIQCIAVGSGLGRLVFGWLADKPGIDRILLQQISFYVIGILTIILPFVPAYGYLVAIALIMGLFDGAFISLIGPIAIELCGKAYAAQAIGCMLGLAAAPVSFGPPIAAYIYDNYTSSYTLPFVLAGVSPLVGATLMFSVRFYRLSLKRSSRNTNGISSHPPDVQMDGLPTSSLLKN